MDLLRQHDFGCPPSKPLLHGVSHWAGLAGRERVELGLEGGARAVLGLRRETHMFQKEAIHTGKRRRGSTRAENGGVRLGHC